MSNLETSIDFYTQVLGFIRRFEDVHEGWTRVGLAIGDTVLELFSRRTTPQSGRKVDPFYPMALGWPKIALTVVDLEVSYERLVANGITPLCPIVSTSVSRFFFIRDPDGTPIQLHEFRGGTTAGRRVLWVNGGRPLTKGSWLTSGETAADAPKR